MRWCCEHFESYFENAGLRGVSVFAVSNSDQDVFFLFQNRAMDTQNNSPVQSEVPVTLASEVAIFYCPWCGRHLNKFYSKHIPGLLRNDLRVLT